MNMANTRKFSENSSDVRSLLENAARRLTEILQDEFLMAETPLEVRDVIESPTARSSNGSHPFCRRREGEKIFEVRWLRYQIHSSRQRTFPEPGRRRMAADRLYFLRSHAGGRVARSLTNRHFDQVGL
jgi:hypothetical protein